VECWIVLNYKHILIINPSTATAFLPKSLPTPLNLKWKMETSHEDARHEANASPHGFDTLRKALSGGEWLKFPNPVSSLILCAFVALCEPRHSVSRLNFRLSRICDRQKGASGCQLTSIGWQLHFCDRQPELSGGQRGGLPARCILATHRSRMSGHQKASIASQPPSNPRQPISDERQTSFGGSQTTLGSDLRNRAGPIRESERRATKDGGNALGKRVRISRG